MEIKEKGQIIFTEEEFAALQKTVFILDDLYVKTTDKASIYCLHKLLFSEQDLIDISNKIFRLGFYKTQLKEREE